MSIDTVCLGPVPGEHRGCTNARSSPLPPCHSPGLHAQEGHHWTRAGSWFHSDTKEVNKTPCSSPDGPGLCRPGVPNLFWATDRFMSDNIFADRHALLLRMHISVASSTHCIADTVKGKQHQ